MHTVYIPLPFIQVNFCLQLIYMCNSGPHSQVILNSMHKYQPRVHIVKANDEKSISLQPADRDSFTTHIFPETQFMAVTAYQNQQVRM